MSRNGRTATDFSEIAVAAGVVAGAIDAAGVAACSVVARFESQNLSAAKYASATAITTTMARFRRCPVSFLIDRCGSGNGSRLQALGRDLVNPSEQKHSREADGHEYHH